MRFLLSLFLAFTFIIIPASGNDVSQSPHEEMLIEERFGITLPDPFRWMENMDDPGLVEWIQKQNENTNRYVSGDLFDTIKAEMEKSIKLTRDVLENDDLQQFEIDKFQDDDYDLMHLPLLRGEKRVRVLNSPRGRYRAEIKSDSRSDFSRVEIIDPKTNHRLKDILMVKFCRIIWDKDETSFVYKTSRDGRLGHAYPGIFRPKSKLIILPAP